LLRAAAAAEEGELKASVLEEIVVRTLPPIPVDYVELASQESVERLEAVDRPSFLALAARVGKIRLIDNVAFDLVAGSVVADRGVRLERASLLYR
jgi:pantoate--beta-alanine ligase